MAKNIPSDVKKKATALGLDKVLDYYMAHDFVEITGKAGGDVLTFRVYHNGMIVER